MYVEGLFDRDFYRLALKALGIHDVQVYPISTVEITSEMLAAAGFSEGERQRVQFAAAQLSQTKDIYHQVIFLVDADMDYLLDAPPPNAPLEWTAGTSAEVIMWNKSSLERFFEVALARQDANSKANSIMPFVESIVTQVCCLRAAKEKAGKDWNLIDIADAFSAKSEFSFDDYCQKVASRNKAHKEFKEEISPLLGEIIERAKTLETPQKMHGHDLMAALARKLKIDGLKQGCLDDPHELGRLMLASLEWGTVTTDETLAKLKKKFPNPSKTVNGAFG